MSCAQIHRHTKSSSHHDQRQTTGSTTLSQNDLHWILSWTGFHSICLSKKCLSVLNNRFKGLIPADGNIKRLIFTPNGQM